MFSYTQRKKDGIFLGKRLVFVNALKPILSLNQQRNFHIVNHDGHKKLQVA
jgi:hypothetical protein